MRKGDERKQEILTVAERLFGSKGFADTSIQDILDILKVSKGGFYHHFESKEAVLDTICIQRAKNSAASCEAALIGETDPIKRLNIILYYAMPLRREEQSMIAMLLPLLHKPESIALRVRYQEALRDAILPMLEKEITQMHRDGIIYPAMREAAGLVLLLTNQCWLEAALLLLQGMNQAQRYDSAALMNTLDCYRRSIEVLLDAPFGSIALIDFSEWDAVADGVFKQLRLTGE